MDLLRYLRRSRSSSGRPLGLFLPGWGAPPELYGAGLPEGWIALRPPDFDRSHLDFDSYRAWILEELERFDRPLLIAGHSMGGAMAICAAAAMPARIDRLLLVSPAGLPLCKPISRSLLDFTLQLAGGKYPFGPVIDGIRDTLSSPRAALAVARSVHGLDLSREMVLVRDHGIPVTVVGCTTDTLVTIWHCRQAAHLLGASYRELDLDGGHMWMLRSWNRFRSELSTA